MTYCVAIKTREGIVYAADTRTNAGLDNIQRHRKLHHFEIPDRASFTILSAGSLSTTQAVLFKLQEDALENNAASLLSCQNLTDVVYYIKSIIQEQQKKIKALSANPNLLNLTVTFIIGGQFKEQPQGLFKISSEGDIQSITEEGCFHSGISSYGENLTASNLKNGLGLNKINYLALYALIKTAANNLTVGPPFDLATQKNDCLYLSSRLRIEEDSALYYEIKKDVHDSIFKHDFILPENLLMLAKNPSIQSNKKNHKIKFV